MSCSLIMLHGLTVIKNLHCEYCSLMEDKMNLDAERSSEAVWTDNMMTIKRKIDNEDNNINKYPESVSDLFL